MNKMTKKNNRRPLTLARETIRQLATKDLSLVAGGNTSNTSVVSIYIVC